MVETVFQVLTVHQVQKVFGDEPVTTVLLVQPVQMVNQVNKVLQVLMVLQVFQVDQVQLLTEKSS
jgi:hypothetical protein